MIRDWKVKGHVREPFVTNAVSRLGKSREAKASRSAMSAYQRSALELKLPIFTGGKYAKPQAKATRHGLALMRRAIDRAKHISLGSSRGTRYVHYWCSDSSGNDSA